MKKRICLLLFSLLLTTGCTCEYNLKIENNTYKEEIKLTANDTEELNNFNNKWNISINKNENNIGTDPETKEDPTESGTYEYVLSGNNLTFNHNFNQNEYIYSTAVSKCYNNISVTRHQNSIIISTSQNTICFDNYPNLNNVVINITVDKKVISNNADNINGNVYTWNLTKANANKAINIVLDNSNEETKIIENPNQSKNDTNNKRDYTMYIFSGILLIVFLLGYLIFNKIKNKGNDMDV